MITRFKALPKDFTVDELTRLFAMFGFQIDNKGKTSGSRVMYSNEVKELSYILHKPHPSNIVKAFIMKDVKEFLVDNKFITED